MGFVRWWQWGGNRVAARLLPCFSFFFLEVDDEGRRGEGGELIMVAKGVFGCDFWWYKGREVVVLWW